MSNSIVPITSPLNTYKTLFLVKAILNVFLALFFLLYAALGNFFTNLFDAIPTEEQIPFNPGAIFYTIGMVGFGLCAILSVLTFLTSKYIGEARNYNFVFAMALINCLTGFLGIILCVFTLIELSKEHTKGLFQENR